MPEVTAGLRERLAEVLEHVEGMVACHSRDWGAWHRDAWLYGILVGWSGEAMRELAERHGWSDEDVARLRRYRQTVTEVQR